MTDAIAQARKTIENRVVEIRDELSQLDKALSALTDPTGGRRGRGRPRTKGTNSRRRRNAGRGGRRGQLLASITKHPNYRITDHAKASKMSPNHASSVVRDLVSSGEVKKVGRGRYETKAEG